MTLIELLVVIVIITTLVAAAIPLLTPSNDERRLREAARGLNAFISGAQSRAIGTRRPYGVALKRLSQDTQKPEDRGTCVELFYIEQPAPYAGFDANSRACVALQGANVIVRFVTRGSATPGLPLGWAVDLFPDSSIRPGDLIEVNGTQFELLQPTGTGLIIDPVTGAYRQTNPDRLAMIVARRKNNSGQQINPKYDDAGAEIGAVAQPRAPYWTSPAPYKVLRRPAPTSDPPFQMPEGMAIDLRASGVGSESFFYNPVPDNPFDRVDNDDGILIMFAPEGRVSRLSLTVNPPTVPSPPGQKFDESVVDNLFLLVGRRDRTPPPDVASDPTLQSAMVAAAVNEEQLAQLREPINWLSGSSQWIAIGSQSGRVVTIENGAVDMAAVLAEPNLPFSTASQSSEEMRSAQILAAREFTREMAQVGGR